MNTSESLSKHIREVYFGGNWSGSNYKDSLADVSWEEAITQIHSFNTIATLVFHTHYFIPVLTHVLKGGPLDGNDTLSFDHPQIESEADWQAFLAEVWKSAEELSIEVTKLSKEELTQEFTDPKYGDYFRNIAGIAEHLHYHLGQINLIKKLIKQGFKN